MSNEPAITQWLEQLCLGDTDGVAMRQLWEHYFQPLTRIIDRRLPKHVRRAFDKEDIAASAFHSFCEGVADDRFPQLDNRDNLWALLVLIAARKSQAYLRAHRRVKRGGGLVQGESGIGPAPQASPFGINQVPAFDDSPAMAAEFSDLVQTLFDGLGNQDLQAIAALKLQSFTISQIAEQLGFTKRTVQRRLELIRRIWRESYPALIGDEAR